MKPRIVFLRGVLAVTLVGSAAFASAQPTRGPQSFEAFDTNGDGCISREEFAAGQSAMQAQRGQRGQGKGQGMGRNAPSFQDFDLNNDGAITPDEFDQARAKRVEERAAAGFPMRGMGNMPSFEEIDTDHSGAITPAEFQAHQAKHRQQGPAGARKPATPPASR